MATAPLGTQVRPYRDYLTPTLHRKFNKASRYTLLLCYLIACWMGEWGNALWTWFPIGPTGIRTLLIFLSALLIFVLRVAQWHVGDRQTQTRAETFKKYALRWSTLVTFMLYAFSAAFYAEVYIWSRTSKSRLGFTDAGRLHERMKLNERPLYLRFLFYVLALAQTILHLKGDYDSIAVPALKPKQDREDKDAPVTSTRRSPPPRAVLLKTLPGLFTKSAIVAFSSWIIGSIVYYVGLRNVIWGYYYSFSRYVITLSKTSHATGVAPFLPLVFGYITEGSLLVLLWQFVNKAFDLYIEQEPLKNAKPITGESQDPNGTLLNGMKSRKDTVKAIAFWELALITESFPDRRKTIYGELDRKKAPTFQQINDLCLGEVKLLIERINIGLNPAFNASPAASSSQPTAPVNLVPQIAQPLTVDKQITAPPTAPSSKWERMEATTASLAKSHSSSANAQQAYGREALNAGMKKASDSAAQAETVVSRYFNALISSPLGFPFRQSLPRTAKLVILGAPYSRISLICNAVTALTNLTTFSLVNDDYGRWHEGVPSIIRIFTTAIKRIDDFMAKVEIHWSDDETLKKDEAERRNVKEVTEVRECLRDGLERIVGSFNEYLGSMGLSKVEILEAKKVLGAKESGVKKLEMAQVPVGATGAVAK